MRIFSWARTPSRWLRVALLAVVLGFGLNTIAHVSHGHDAATVSSHHLSCGHCLYFGHLADAARHAHTLAPHVSQTPVAAALDRAVPSRVPALAAQPRAPPLA